VLHAVVFDEPPPPVGGERMATGAWSLAQLVAHLPKLAAGLEPIAETLAAAAMLNGKGLASLGGPVWTPTDFGRRCLTYLHGT